VFLETSNSSRINPFSPPWIPFEGFPVLFGGFVLGQSVAAAQETVETTFVVYSLQGMYPSPGNLQGDIQYHVERTTSGRNFATRHVRAVQNGVCIFIATLGFQNSAVKTRNVGHVLNYDTPLPDLGGVQPEDLVDSARRQREILLEVGLNGRSLDTGTPDPFEWRPLPFKKTDDPSQFRMYSFVRSSSPLSTDRQSVHLSAMAFFTDELFLGLPAFATPEAMGKRSSNVALQVTLSHSIMFHSSTVRADEWLVCERETSWATEGRVLVSQRLWSLSTGRLVLTCHQEGLIMLKSPVKL
jgi:acyl-CoA thioesterase II